LHLTIQRLDLVAAINAAIESVRLAADAKSIQIAYSLMPTTLAEPLGTRIVGDIDRLGQVFWNLLTNAIKFTPTGGRVEITAIASPTELQIRVSDTGQGIEAELLPYIFDRFRQGDSSRTKKTQGLGLGLSIVRHIIELHGGTVGAESAGVGQGATIIVRLPIDSAAIDLVPATPRQLPAQQAASALAGLRILVVDDEVDILDLMRYILETAGASVTTATSAQAAIETLIDSGGGYDVLFADIGMPDEDGLALIRQVRALAADAGGRVPAAAITAYVSDRERQLALAAGFEMHLSKPIAPDLLIHIASILTGRSIA
jgi:two-component system, chemotaxis family, CheB/CheR fusion protein